MKSSFVLEEDIDFIPLFCPFYGSITALMLPYICKMCGNDSLASKEILRIVKFTTRQYEYLESSSGYIGLCYPSGFILDDNYLCSFTCLQLYTLNRGFDNYEDNFK